MSHVRRPLLSEYVCGRQVGGAKPDRGVAECFRTYIDAIATSDAAVLGDPPSLARIPSLANYPRPWIEMHLSKRLGQEEFRHQSILGSFASG